MKVKYNMDEKKLFAKLYQDYGIEAAQLNFIPVGDSAYSYKLNCTDGKSYYLKLFDNHNDNQRNRVEHLDFSLNVTWKMYHEGFFKQLTYPIKNKCGQFMTTFHTISLVLFNFIEGKTLANAYPLSKEILIKIARSVSRIHQSIMMIGQKTARKEDFDISFEKDLTDCILFLETTSEFENPYHQRLKEVILDKQEKIVHFHKLLVKLRELAYNTEKEMVLTHGDVWGGNLILDMKSDLHFLDWEGALIAPPERDLFSYIDQDFLTHYELQWCRPVDLNIDLLRFYSYRHHLKNLTNWILNILYLSSDEEQNENDLDMIIHHCLNRFEGIESSLNNVL
jgi:spectinomycin phosphotransferase